MDSRILFTGAYSQTDLTSIYNEISSRKIDPQIERKAGQLWQERVSEASKKKQKLWDASVYRLEDYDCGDGCKLVFSNIPFSIRMGLQTCTSELLKLGGDYLPMATYTSLFIETEDHNFVFGSKSNQYNTNRTYTYIGGVFNQTENVEIDLFESVKSEITEELGVSESMFEKLHLIGAFQSKTGNVGFIFYCKLAIKSEELQKIFNKREDYEIKSIYFVDRNDVREFCTSSIGKESEMVDIFDLYIQ